MKNTMYATLVALVAGCGLAHADQPGQLHRYYDQAPPVERERVIERESHETYVVPSCNEAIGFCPNENTGCEVHIYGPNASIVLFSTHLRDGVELKGPSGPNEVIARERLANLRADGYCTAGEAQVFRHGGPGIIPGALIPPPGAGIEGEAPINAGPAGIVRPFFGR